MTVTAANGGAEEFVYSAQNTALTLTPGGNYVAGYYPAHAFTVMSNTLDNPALLACPSDSTAPHSTPATNWVQFYTTGTTVNYEARNDTYLSYFVCGDSIDTQPQSILAGDRNIGNGNNGAGGGTPSGSTANSMFYTANVNNACNGVANQGGGLGKGVDFALWSWSANDIHLGAGNLLLGDGSAQQATISDLQKDLLTATNGTTASPFYNFPN
jgi:hypothetical protein